MELLAFRLYAPLASWGEPAVGEHRPSHNYPGRSAILGLLAAALGIRRDEDEQLAELAAGYGVAVAVYAGGSLLRDYHTAQVPSAKDLKQRPHRTRADELALPKADLNTILSTRDYRQDALSAVLLWCTTPSAPFTLDALSQALRAPRFTLYLGRKACPPALPLHPHCVEAATLYEALQRTQFPIFSELRDASVLQRLAWEGDEVQPGISRAAVFSVLRKDEPRSRRRWQFADRREWVALLSEELPTLEEAL